MSITTINNYIVHLPLFFISSSVLFEVITKLTHLDIIHASVFTSKSAVDSNRANMIPRRVGKEEVGRVAPKSEEGL